MNTTKTLIILTPGFPANEADTTCITSQQLFVKACKENNPWLKLEVMSFQYPFKPGSYKWHGITVNSFNGRNKGQVARLLTWIRVWKAMNTIRKKNHVIGILSFWLGECALIGTLFCKRHHLKHFTWILGQDAKKHNRYQRFIKPHPSSLVALSDFIAREYMKNYGARPEHIVPVGIDTAAFNEEEQIRDIDVMGAGSLIPLKRYELFIAVMKELVQYYPKISAVICGKGPEKSRLLSQLQEAGLQNNIILLNELPHIEVLKLMQRSKIFFHTSEYEGYGTVCAEALYAGAQVVSFCKPMNRCLPQQHIVETKDQAIYKLREVLQDENSTHHRILDHSINEISRRMIDLFVQ